MLTPVMPYSIKGAIWYQGESNVDNNYEYQELFTGMIEDWRENWGYDFSFYYAQIAPFEYTPSQDSHKLREAQRKTLVTSRKTGMAVLMDIGEEGDIHPHNKLDVGKRLALLALNKDYEFDILSSGPLYKSIETFKNYIEIDFESKGSGLMSNGVLKDFEIAGDDMVYKTAEAEIEWPKQWDTAKLRAKLVKQGPNIKICAKRQKWAITVVSIFVRNSHQQIVFFMRSPNSERFIKQNSQFPEERIFVAIFLRGNIFLLAKAVHANFFTVRISDWQDK